MQALMDVAGPALLVIVTVMVLRGDLRTRRQNAALRDLLYEPGQGDLVSRHLDALAGQLPQVPVTTDDALLEEATRRLALALDIPVEMLGTPDPNRDRHVAFPDREEER